MPRRIAVVPHTHWDREWYSSFQTFRLKLVELLDRLLPMLESDPSYTHFQLDGQMAPVDDYLAIRPDAAERLRSLAVAGRLSIGPWYTLPDEFLVSGETHVRNLQLGFSRAARFGGASKVGYLPDMFGHIAQMPQLLRQFGLEHAVVWRGVPSAIDRDAFWWEAPDGSVVRAEYLVQGYGNGAHLPDDAKDLTERVRYFEQDHEEMLTGDLLWMNGTDHLMPQPWLGRVVAEANAVQDDYVFEVTSLSEYLAGAPTSGLGRWRGELRSGARANLLMGVASNRVDIKQAAAMAERELERLAEPLSALFGDESHWPQALLDEAWLKMIHNAAHDSVCGCSADDVCDAVLVRYREATSVAEGLRDRAIRRLAASMSEAGAVLVNPSPRARAAIVELRLPGEGEEPGVQLLSQRPTELALQLTRSDALQVVQALLDSQEGFQEAEVTETGGTLEVTLHRGTAGSEQITAAAVLARMRSLATDDPASPTSVRITRPPVRRVLVRAGEVPGYGWVRWEPEPLSCDPVIAQDGALDNGLVRVEVSRTDGTFSYNDLRGLGLLVDGGDCGDTYNYNPPDEDVEVAEPVEVTVSTVESGPLRGRLVVESRHLWPDRVAATSRVGEREVEVLTTLELCAGEELVRVTVELDNQSRDHRLRALFPLPEPADRSMAECAFTVVERGLEAEGGPTERGLPTFPSRRFVKAGGLTVVHEGLLEYELVEIRSGRAHALALTLLRATGMLSQGPMRNRPLPAGPLQPLRGSQMLGPQVFRYAVHVGDTNPYELVDAAFLPVLVAEAPGGGWRERRGQVLDVRGAEVSAVRREGGALVVRLFNPTSEPTTAEILGRQGWRVDLRGRPVEAFDERIELGPHAIATLQLLS